MSSHVAMSGMLALFPFLLFILSLAGTLSQDIATDDVIDLIFGSWPPEIADPIVKEVRAVLAGGVSGAMTVGGLLALFFASNGVDAIRQAISAAYHDEDTRPFWKNRLICLGIVIGGAMTILLIATFGLAIPAYLNVMRSLLPEDVGVAPSGGWMTDRTLLVGLTSLLLVVGVFACHTLLPDRRHSLKRVWPGVVMTLLFWAVAAQGFGFYISHFATYSATYAGLAGAMSALIFLYLMSAIMILGAEFNGALMGTDPGEGGGNNGEATS